LAGKKKNPISITIILNGKDKVKRLPCNSSGREHSQKKILDLT
jgi:hypothetical protein